MLCEVEYIVGGFGRTSMTNWKERYEQLAKLTNEINQKLLDLEYSRSRIGTHLRESDRLDLNDRNVCRLMRLKEEITIAVEYDGREAEKKTYPAGTLIEFELNGHVYLDDDGDGNLYFPIHLLEPVELDRDSVDWDSVITQG